MSDLQLRIRELYERQAQQDVLTLGITVDEYIRLIGSIKTAFTQRQKAFHTWHAAESEMQKRKTTQDKLLRQGKTQQDRLNQMGADVGDAERKVHQARLLFEDMGRLMRGELERFEREKVEDFKNGVETFLESAIEAQKEVSQHLSQPHLELPMLIIVLWEIVNRAMGNFPHATRRRRGRAAISQTILSRSGTSHRITTDSRVKSKASR